MGIKFYSEYDMACGHELNKAIEKISTSGLDNEWNALDLFEFYNIIKYLKFEEFKNYISTDTKIEIEALEKSIMANIGQFIDKNKKHFLNLYDEIDFEYEDDFFEIMEAHKLFEQINEEDFRRFINKENVHIWSVLKRRKLVETFDETIRQFLLAHPQYADTILSKYLKEQPVFLPSTLTKQEILNILDEYIDSTEVNLNVLREIVNFPANKELKINDKIKLHAKRKAKEEESKIFSSGNGLETSVSITYPDNVEETVQFNMSGTKAEIKISRKWIEENLDFPTLWNNFIYLFNFTDDKMRLELDSKKSEKGVLEAIIQPDAEHLYCRSFSFSFKEMLSNVEIISYARVLQGYGIRLEGMIEWFFNEYILEEFNVTDYVVRMPSETATYFEKCRTILPEIDRILKQYNTLVEDGKIEQELIQMSSNSTRIKDIKSYSDKKYVYADSEWYGIASYLLFSDQSSIFYIHDREKQYKNFFELISLEKPTKNVFQDYQLSKMQWLFENDFIHETEDGTIKFVDEIIIYILFELFYKEVLSFWRYPINVRVKIDELYKRNLVVFENSLFSKNEQDYLDYHLNKSKFTNGYDIRNKYLHGANLNDEKQYESDYYLILKFFFIIVIKINDDLCIKEDYMKLG
ncbi:MAG: hypothetical protein WC755_07515 [Candidatus Woesearchaeota archaeon]